MELLIIFVVVAVFVTYIIVLTVAVRTEQARLKDKNQVFYSLIREKNKITAADFAIACANYNFGRFKKGLIIEARESQLFLRKKCKELGGSGISQGNAIIYSFEDTEIHN